MPRRKFCQILAAIIVSENWNVSTMAAAQTHTIDCNIVVLTLFRHREIECVLVWAWALQLSAAVSIASDNHTCSTCTPNRLQCDQWGTCVDLVPTRGGGLRGKANERTFGDERKAPKISRQSIQPHARHDRRLCCENAVSL